MPNKLRLESPAWTAEVVHAASLSNHKPLVACQNNTDHREAAEWLGARGCKHAITFVISGEGEETALVHNQAGPKPFSFQGSSPPQRKTLAAQVKDDRPATDKVLQKTVPCKLTLAKDFAPAALTEQAETRPQCLPALLLDDSSKCVVQTRGALSYSDSTT